MWVFPSKLGELREGNSENLKHGNGNRENSVTRGVERKIGAPIVQRNPERPFSHNIHSHRLAAEM
jgi:hypothetical protein